MESIKNYVPVFNTGSPQVKTEGTQFDAIRLAKEKLCLENVLRAGDSLLKISETTRNHKKKSNKICCRNILGFLLLKKKNTEHALFKIVSILSQCHPIRSSS